MFQNCDEAKRALIALVNELDEIEKARNTRMNVFEAAGMRVQEIKHSAFLAWLLNPKSPHGLGSLFLKIFCERVIPYVTEIDGVRSNCEIIGANLSRLEEFLTDNNLEVATEKVVVNSESRIDIFIASPAAKTAIVIENKVFTTMHDDQLNRYEKELALHGEYKNYNKVFIYLTPNGDSPYDDDWCIFDYGSVLKIANEIYKGLPKTKDALRLKILLEDYMELVETNILKENKELRKLCKEIKRRHAAALELLNSYTDNAVEVIAYCKKRVEAEINGTVILKSSNQAVYFYTGAMKDYFDQFGEDIRNEEMAKCCGEFICSKDYISVVVSLKKSREEEWSAAQLAMMEKIAPNKKRGDMFFSLASAAILTPDLRDLPFKAVKPTADKNLSAFIDRCVKSGIM